VVFINELCFVVAGYLEVEVRGMSPYRHILDGYKILDFTQFVAGPTVTRLLAEMGAEVIKVELAPGGDPLRTMYVFKDGRSSLFVQHNRGKMSLCLNAKSAAGREILTDLVRRVDVIVENFTPGAIVRLGLGYEVVSRINPRVIMCSISGFGQNGPLADKPGFDTLGASYAGVIDMNGSADGAPCPPGAAIGDVTAGLNGAASIGFALLHRERTGRGQYLDISLLDTYFHCHDFSVQAFSASGGAIQAHGAQRSRLCACGRLRGQTAIDRDNGDYGGAMALAVRGNRASRNGQ
jgi:crotonobetainyl-CoA:carnitine CoA-transferase CaiB-like acyl-CoA transferase